MVTAQKDPERLSPPFPWGRQARLCPPQLPLQVAQSRRPPEGKSTRAGPTPSLGTSSSTASCKIPSLEKAGLNWHPAASTSPGSGRPQRVRGRQPLFPPLALVPLETAVPALQPSNSKAGGGGLAQGRCWSCPGSSRGPRAAKGRAALGLPTQVLCGMTGPGQPPLSASHPPTHRGLRPAFSHCLLCVGVHTHTPLWSGRRAPATRQSAGGGRREGGRVQGSPLGARLGLRASWCMPRPPPEGKL